MANSCSLIFSNDEDFGQISTIEKKLPDEGKFVINPLELEHLSEEQQRQLYGVINQYQRVFSDEPGFCDVTEHEIRLQEGFKSKRLRAYKIPELVKEVKKQIQEMLDNKIITPSNSEMASPVVCVLKKSGGPNSVRLAIDFRHVNKHPMGDFQHQMSKTYYKKSEGQGGSVVSMPRTVTGKYQ